MSESKKWHADKYNDDLGSYIQNTAIELLLKDCSFEGRQAILDIGCGSGKDTLKIAERAPQAQVLGVDLSPDMIAFANKTYQDQANLSFLERNVLALNFENQFDLITSFHCLHWVDDQPQALKNACRALKQGGHLYLTIPNISSGHIPIIMNKLMNADKWQQYFTDFKPVVYHRSNEELANALHEENMQNVSVADGDLEIDLPEFEYFRYFLEAFPCLAPQIPKELQQSFVDDMYDAFVEDCHQRYHGKPVYDHALQIVKADKL